MRAIVLIDRRVAVRMEFTQHFAHNTSGFLIRGIGTDTQFMHGIQNTPMDRFQPIAGIWKGARYNHAHGIIQIRLPHLGININLLDISVLTV